MAFSVLTCYNSHIWSIFIPTKHTRLTGRKFLHGRSFHTPTVVRYFSRCSYSPATAAVHMMSDFILFATCPLPLPLSFTYDSMDRSGCLHIDTRNSYPLSLDAIFCMNWREVSEQSNTNISSNKLSPLRSFLYDHQQASFATKSFCVQFRLDL